MNTNEIKSTPSGKYVKIEDGAFAFVPNPLPLKTNYDKEIIYYLIKAERALGELKGSIEAIQECMSLPFSPALFFKPYFYREAYWSTKIEGTKTTLEDIYISEIKQSKKEKYDDKEILNYVAAIIHGNFRPGNRPISYNLIKEMHRILLKGTRGQHKSPGKVRKSHTRIGGSSFKNARYIPPPVPQMLERLDNLEKYITLNTQDFPLIQCAIVHAQFEMIHPFYYGNGRVGRLLINLFLITKGYLAAFLFISEYFDKNKQEYYERLLSISQKGEWREWIVFFLKGVIEKSKDAKNNFSNIASIYVEYLDKLKNTKGVPKNTDKLIDEMFINPYISISQKSKKWGMPYNQVKRIINKLVELKILVEITFKKRNKLYFPPKLIEWIIPRNED